MPMRHETEGSALDERIQYRVGNHHFTNHKRASMDTIFIRELRLPAWIGLYTHEKISQQTVEIDIEMGLPNDAVFETHKVRDTIDYGVVCEKVREMLNRERFGLVESLAARIAQILIDDFKSPKVVISITKLGVLKDAKRVGVRVERSRAPG